MESEQQPRQEEQEPGNDNDEMELAEERASVNASHVVVGSSESENVEKDARTNMIDEPNEKTENHVNKDDHEEDDSKANGAVDTTAIQIEDDDSADANTPSLPSIKTSGITATAPAINSNDYKTMAKMAMTLAKHNRLGAGSKSAYEAKMSDIGALGIGLQLYFMLTKYLSWAFLIMGIITLPTIILNHAGHGITSKMADPLQLAYASLGNQGVNSEIANDPNLCLPLGDIDCNWTTVNTPFTTDPFKVTWIITISDCLYSIFFLGFYAFYRYYAKKAIDTHMNENLTPAKYAVYIRGLPVDATEEEILQHFNTLYDLTKEEESSPLWFGLFWGKRHKVKHSLSKRAINRSVVKNLDHLAGSSSSHPNKEIYLNTWIAEVSIGHPTGGLLRTFLSMEALNQSIAETLTLIQTLNEEKKASPSTFKPRDEKLIHTSTKKLEKLNAQRQKKTSKIKALKQAIPDTKSSAKSKQKKQENNITSKNKRQQARAKVTAAAHAAKQSATANTNTAFNWDACECAFVVFNNLESRRRCLHDYRNSTHWFVRKFQPKVLRFRQGKYPLIVVPAPEPSNILWENLEITEKGRFYRRSLTSFITFLLLLFSCIIISAAQTAQQQFADKMPPSGLCETSLPEIFYGNDSYASDPEIQWILAWEKTATCSAGTNGRKRYHIAYTNGIVNDLNISNPSAAYTSADPPVRCVDDPCVSEASSQVCNTLPCFDQDMLDAGDDCETYLASHVLYCYCSSTLTSSIKMYGYIQGPKKLWQDNEPCRGFIKDYLTKNGFIVVAAAVVVIVNMLLNTILRAFATFERHSSESAKASAIALKMFSAQFLNTAVIVLIVNASLGLSNTAVVKELFKGKYQDFQREWYPTVGMGITTTMLINALLPQISLFVRMFVFAPITRAIQRRKIRTQEQMNKLYAGPEFDISVRYPMLLNSIFVTMAFCGGSPILLFIAALACAGTYWFDKLSILHLYSVTTTYDEVLGEVALTLLPWTLVLHLGFSTWMYGNSDLMQSTMLDIKWVLRLVGLSSVVNKYPGASNEQLYEQLVKDASTYDVLGKYGFVVKVVRSNVTIMFLFFVGSIFCILLSTVWLQFGYPVLVHLAKLIKRLICLPLRNESTQSKQDTKKKAKKPIVIPEFTDFFRKSVISSFRPDKALGFERNQEGELICRWQHETMIYGFKRKPGDMKRTWEAMQAPVKMYAIEANGKYRLAVNEIVEAAHIIRKASTAVKLHAVAPMYDEPESNQIREVNAAITATEPVAEDSNQQVNEANLSIDEPKQMAAEIDAISAAIAETEPISAVDGKEEMGSEMEAESKSIDDASNDQSTTTNTD